MEFRVQDPATDFVGLIWQLTYVKFGVYLLTASLEEHQQHHVCRCFLGNRGRSSLQALNPEP